MSKTVTFTKKEYAALKKRYDKAVKNNENEFTFEGNEYLTTYAKYVLEYLKPKFKQQKM